MDWKPISEAPKDGREVLILNSEGAEVAEWLDYSEGDQYDPGNDAGWLGQRFAHPGCKRFRNTPPRGQPTHFAFIPDAPE